jgi:hypothetical protein
MSDHERQSRPLPEPTSDPDRKVLRDVKAYGWHVLNVGSTDELPPWAFTIGLFHTYGHPEIVVFGLPQEVAHFLLNEVASGVKDGRSVELGEERAGLLEGVGCTFRSVDPRWYRAILGYAGWFYGGTDFPAVQCIWPDREGYWPWEPGFRMDWIPQQPLLFEQNAEAARMGAILSSLGLDDAV